ncbi:MAG: cobalamin biosynthesis protein CbiB [Rhodoferax sp.]|nr:cobalamin biosynthesis protein CbiB [Rhodoferax sp.]
MSFVSVLIALLLEQARPIQPGNWIHSMSRMWIRWVGHSFDAGQASHSWLIWSLAVLLPAGVATAVHWALMSLVGWPLALMWNVTVLYVTLGFRQFSFHFTRIRDALEQGDHATAVKLLAQWRRRESADLPKGEMVRHVIEFSVIAAHRHVFGVIVWFSLLAAMGLGPAGAIIYRLSEFVGRYWQHPGVTPLQPVSAALQQSARTAWYGADWLPARLTALGFAMVGSFEEAIDGWRRHEASGISDNDGVILAATAGAVGLPLGRTGSSAVPEEQLSSAHLTVVVGLVWRTVVMWVVLLALLTLSRFLG